MRFRLLLFASAGAAFLGGYFVASSDAARLSGVSRFVRRAAAAGEIVARASVGKSENRAVHAALSALEEKDSLRRDHLLYLAIQEMNGADFQALFADLPALWKKVQDLSYETQQMLLEAAAERWLSVDAKGAMRWLDGGVLLLGLAEKGGHTVDVQQLGGLFKVLARHQPEWVLRHLDKLGDPRFPWGARFMTVQELVFSAAKRSRAEARDWIEQMPTSGDQAAAWKGLISGLAEASPTAALEEAISQKQKPFFNELANISAAAAARDGPAAAQLLVDRVEDLYIRRGMVWAALGATANSSSGDPIEWFATQLERDPGLLKESSHSRALALQELTARAPKEAADLLASIDPIKRDDSLLHTVLNIWSWSAPEDALAWIGRQPIELLQDSKHLTGLLQGMSQKVPEEFERWSAALPNGKLRAAAESVHISELIENDRISDALNLASNFLSHDTSGIRTSETARQAAQRDGPATAAWVAQLPDEKAKERAAAAVAATWGSAKPQEAAAWIESLPPGNVRDGAMGAYGRMVAYSDPAVAAEWLDRIENPTVKERAVNDTFWTWAWEDPERARQFLREVSGVSAEWKEEMLRRAK